MKKLKFKYLSVIPEQKMFITIRSAGIFARSFRILIITTAIVICLPLSKTNAQNLHIDNTIKSTYPEIKILSIEMHGFTKLFDFYGPESGKFPEEIIISDNWIYGHNYSGGAYDYGLIYKIKTDGSWLMRIAFDGTKAYGLVLSGSVLYGATRYAGTYDGGVLYKINTDGTGFTILYNFQKDFDYPVFNLIISGNIIYGHVFDNLEGSGYIFKINTDGTDFTKLSDISNFPYADLLFYDNYLYGITWGGSNTSGEIFKLKNDGSGFLTLHSFDNPEDGQNAYNSLTIVGNSLYGTTESGGKNNLGTLFKINTDGTNYKKLHDFSSTRGAFVRSKLVQSGSFLYGTAYAGGTFGLGTIFRFNKDGSGFEKLFDFQNETDGKGPEKFVMSGDTIFGYTAEGGINDDGTIFKYIIDEPQIIPVEPPKIVTLSISKPEVITLETKKDLIIDNGKFIDLDTTFSVEGNIPYTHSWNIKTGNDFQKINNKVNINQNITFYLFVTTDQGCTYTDSVTVQAKNVTGIEESVTNENQIIIYPNPNPGIFQIEILEGNANYEYDIFDVSGRKVANGNIYCLTNECVQNIKLDNVKPGAYNLVIRRAYKFYGQKKLMIHSL